MSYDIVIIVLLQVTQSAITIINTIDVLVDCCKPRRITFRKYSSTIYIDLPGKYMINSITLVTLQR